MPCGAELQNEWGFLSTGSWLGPPSYSPTRPTQACPLPPPHLTRHICGFLSLSDWVFCCSLYPPVFSHRSFPPQSLSQFPNLVGLWTFCTRPAWARVRELTPTCSCGASQDTPACWLHTLDPHPCAQEVSLAVGSSWTLFRRKQEVFAFEERVRPVDNAGQRHRTLSATGRIYNNVGRSKVKGWKSHAMQTLIKKKAGVGLFILDKRLSIKKGTKDKEMLHNDKRIHPPKHITILKVCDRIQSLKIHEPKTDTLNREIETSTYHWALQYTTFRY